MLKHGYSSCSLSLYAAYAPELACSWHRFLSSLQETVAAEHKTLNCLYCRKPCETDLFAVEPMWSCVWCSAVAHVRCYDQCHPQAGTPDKQVTLT